MSKRFRMSTALDVDDLLMECVPYAIKLANEKYKFDPPLTIYEVDRWGKLGTRADVIFEFFDDPEFFVAIECGAFYEMSLIGFSIFETLYIEVEGVFVHLKGGLAYGVIGGGILCVFDESDFDHDELLVCCEFVVFFTVPILYHTLCDMSIGFGKIIEKYFKKFQQYVTRRD
jgi:hypothetical protein